MNDTATFVAQITSILVYVATLFGLYRLLVSQKDATIEAVREQNELLKEKLSVAEAESPSVLAARLSKRIKLLEGELRRLADDQDSNEQLIKERERELTQVRSEVERYRVELEKAREVLSEYGCPYCGARLAAMEYYPDIALVGGREIDFEHERISYECGLDIQDGEETSPCPHSEEVEVGAPAAPQ